MIFDRVVATTRNWLEVARYGGLETGEEPSPYDVVAQGRIHKLRRYRTTGEAGRPQVLLVPPLMLTADVFDVSPQASGVRTLIENGIDPWVIDFGSPEKEAGGLERNLGDHVLAVDAAIDEMRTLTGGDVHLAGYSQGGMFCYQTSAYRRSVGIASVITFGSPVDLSKTAPMGVPAEIAIPGMGFVMENVLRGRSVPGWATRLGFQLLDPVKAVTGQLQFLAALHDRDALLPREGQRRYLMNDGWVAWPGPALAEFLQQFLVHNRMLRGGFSIAGRPVTLADITSPILAFVGDVDEIAPPASVRGILGAAPRADIYESTLHAGHFGLVVGSTATSHTWPLVADWMRYAEGKGPQPEHVTKVDATSAAAEAAPAGQGEGVQTLIDAGRMVAGSVARSVGDVRGMFGTVSRQMPRLARIRKLDANTRISLALLFDEQAQQAPNDVSFMYEDRSYTYGENKVRIDAVVRGLLAAGVRAGEHVGVLMGTRPSALAVVTALNRIGAVAVMLRPGADTAREVELGKVNRVIADPEHSEADFAGRPLHTFLLDTPYLNRDRTLTALEIGETNAVRIPDWYRPNPGRAGELAFIFFGGPDDDPRPIRVTNGRFGLSAYGTATSATLNNSDTVYCINPIYHTSGLLTGIGGAVAGGSRLAMATDLDPTTFWTEVRRYGVTIVCYTWAQLRPLVNAAPQPAERNHSVRLFVGSGMPRGLWRRVLDRFAPAGVLDFWSTSEGEAILANVNPAKPGSLGRPLPGSATVEVVRWDPEAQQVVSGADGYAIRCAADETGLLLVKISSATTASAPPLRNLFEAGDAWFSSGSLVNRDADGDYWLIDSVDTQIRTADAVVASLPITAAIGKLPAVDLVHTYGVAAHDAEVAVAALSLVDGQDVSAADLDEALASLPAEQRPAFVRVVDEVPMTPWHRPVAGPLRRDPLPPPGRYFTRTDDGSYKEN
ncbi:AMP-binding protein [Mycolicibacterium mucogenicum]|uniref:AMP-binding protein n=2 Tax=Mycolicibacterium mucogenicum TaxID=56689 RepID=UPI000A44FA43|nr:AMP-binding protein [Mycolicibacterium mucogenicum]